MENKIEHKPILGTLYIVSTPIGNDDDLTFRALNTLRNCDIVVCEEAKMGSRLLFRTKIQKSIELLNEQNEEEATGDLIQMLLAGKNLALISDCGTPVFADPGAHLIHDAIEWSIPVVAVPGASSIMAALVVCGFSIDSFVYAGFLSRTNTDRLTEFEDLAKEKRTVVLLETPYRLQPLLEAASEIMPNRRAYIGCNLTMPFETHHRGSMKELNEKFKNLHFKGEFVLVFEGCGEGHVPVKRRTDDRHEEKPFRPRTYERGGLSRSKPSYGRNTKSVGGKKPRFDRDRKFESDKPNYDIDRPRFAPERKFDSDKPRFDREKKFDSDKPRYTSERKFDSDKPRFDREKKFDSDKPRYTSERKFDSDKPRYTPERKFDSDKPRFDRERKFDSDKPRFDREKKFDSEKPRFDREKKFDSDKPRFDKEKKFDSEKPRFDREKKFDSDKPRFDRPKKSDSTKSSFKSDKPRSTRTTSTSKSTRGPGRPRKK